MVVATCRCLKMSNDTFAFDRSTFCSRLFSIIRHRFRSRQFRWFCRIRYITTTLIFSHNFRPFFSYHFYVATCLKCSVVVEKFKHLGTKNLFYFTLTFYMLQIIYYMFIMKQLCKTLIFAILAIFWMMFSFFLIKI